MINKKEGKILFLRLKWEFYQYTMDLMCKILELK